MMDRKQGTISEAVRAQLVALGIPRARHVPETLAAMFPAEFNIGETELSAEDVAKVLIYLIEKNILSVSRTIALKKVEPGWHFCQFYRDFDQLLETIVPYIADGLKNNEACLWVLPEIVTAEAACVALGDEVDNVDACLASGQLEILSHPNWYLDPAGRLKSFAEISSALIAKQDEALARGFKFLRAAGDAGWVSGAEQSKDFIDYEMKVNAAIGATKVAAVCTYRADVSANELIDIITAHQDALSSGAPCQLCSV
jgi:hypothetical protein